MKKFDEIQQIGGHYGDDYEKFLGAVVPPIFSNTIFRFPNYESIDERKITNESRYGYTRIENPTIEDKKDIRLRNLDQAGFYSTVEDALERLPQEKGTPDQMKAMLHKNG